MSAPTASRSSAAKRPRSSSSAQSDDVRSPPHRKKHRRSSSVQAAASPNRSPLIRSRRLSSDLDDMHLHSRMTPAPSVTPAPPPAPPPPVAKRRPRLSLPPPEPDRSHREGSAISISSSQDAEDFAELLRDGFSLQEASLFQRIRKRGLEPLMPAHWQVDFATMPDNLFTGPDDPAYIEAVTLDGTFNATTAFQTLVNLGSLVRGKLEGKQDAEAKILLILRKYIQWSVDDAKLGLNGVEIQPLIAISSSQGKDSEHCEQRMDKKLRDLAATLRAEQSNLHTLGHDPSPTTSSTIYGLAVAGCVAALITLDARSSSTSTPTATRTLLVVDFSDVTTDFWNAIAISLLVIAARDDELERVEFCKERGIDKPVRVNGARSWKGKDRRKKVADEDEDA